MNRTPSLFAGVEPLEVFAELLADLDADTGGGEFYDRICEAICRLTTMRRAAIFMAENKGQRVQAVGSHGTPKSELTSLHPTLNDTPIAQQALRTDAVVVVSDRIEEAVPAEYAALLGITTLVCTPLSAAGRAYGVICADRGGGRFELSDGERHLLWTLGKLASLVATARISTRQEERSRRLADRISLAREIHERVLQRLFGVSLALGVEPGQDDGDQRRRCQTELQEAIADLRRVLAGMRPPSVQELGLAAALRRLAAEWEARSGAGCRLKIAGEGRELAPELEETLFWIVAEALTNVQRHALAGRVAVDVDIRGESAGVRVRDDGQGFDVAAAAATGGAPRLGLLGMRERALAAGGSLEVRSRPGSGTIVEVELPIKVGAAG